MTTYQVSLILSPTLTRPEVEKKLTGIKAQLGEITFEQLWGSRELAYPIRETAGVYQTSGNYVTLGTQMDGTRVTELETALNQDPKVLRHLIEKMDDGHVFIPVEIEN